MKLFNVYCYVLLSLALVTLFIQPVQLITLPSNTKINTQTNQLSTNNLEEIYNKKLLSYQKEMNEKFNKLHNQFLEYQKKYEELKKTSSRVAAQSSQSDYRSREIQNFIYRDARIYQDIFEALEKQVFSKLGNPNAWDETSYRINTWNNRKIIKIGQNENADGNGISVQIPEEYNVLWLRVLNERWTVFKAKYLDNNEDIGKFSCGYRSLNEYSPDGAAPDSSFNYHMWCQIPVEKNRKVGIFSVRQNTDAWISGIAFGKNLWNHARNSAVAYHWTLNGGTPTDWYSHNWNNDNLGTMKGGNVYELKVPVYNTNSDKLVYIIEHNNNWTGTQHTSLSVNGVPIERFRTTYLNPFATHYNSKIYTRYIAAFIPKERLNAQEKFITLKVDLTSANSDNVFHFREIGTHDYADFF